MQPEIAKKLVHLNQEFYQTFGEAFSRTRQRVQPGVRNFLGSAPKTGRWLDLGCGNGQLVLEWSKLGFSGSYYGLDFSERLLNEARNITACFEQVQFTFWDMSSLGFPGEITGDSFNGIMAFAALHHLPGREQRLRLLCTINSCLVDGGMFVLSVWQIQHSLKLMARVQPWARVGITDGDVDPGDCLLDWRYALADQAEQSGMRYVHIFDSDELRSLAHESGFKVEEEWSSDGHGGKLSLYQLWRKN